MWTPEMHINAGCKCHPVKLYPDRRCMLMAGVNRVLVICCSCYGKQRYGKKKMLQGSQAAEWHEANKRAHMLTLAKCSGSLRKTVLSLAMLLLW